jgi:hypothetical protein
MSFLSFAPFAAFARDEFRLNTFPPDNPPPARATNAAAACSIGKMKLTGADIRRL